VDAAFLEQKQSNVKTAAVQVEDLAPVSVDVAIDASRTHEYASVQTDPLIAVKLARDKQSAMDVVFLFDSSASVGERDFSKAKDFVAGLIAEFDMPSVRCGLIRFESACSVISGLEGDRETLLDDLKAMMYSNGETKLARPLRAAAEMFRSAAVWVPLRQLLL
jgi:Mg-chelatase subunit ChlD